MIYGAMKVNLTRYKPKLNLHFLFVVSAIQATSPSLAYSNSFRNVYSVIQCCYQLQQLLRKFNQCSGSTWTFRLLSLRSFFLTWVWTFIVINYLKYLFVFIVFSVYLWAHVLLFHRLIWERRNMCYSNNGYLWKQQSEFVVNVAVIFLNKVLLKMYLLFFKSCKSFK